MKQFIIPLLTVVMVVSMIFVGCIPAPAEPPEATTPAPPIPTSTPPAPALPTPGEWSASTGCREFTFTFTVNPDGTGIPEYSYQFTGFECEFKGGRTQVSSGVMAEISPPRPITGGQFTLDWVERIEYGPDWDAVIQGKFDETGTQASGTWEINAEGTVCQEGTWEASAP